MDQLSYVNILNLEAGSKINICTKKLICTNLQCWINKTGLKVRLLTISTAHCNKANNYPKFFYLVLLKKLHYKWWHISGFKTQKSKQ